MYIGKIITRKTENPTETKGDFSVSFDHQEFGPYEYLYERKKLYFHEASGERGNTSFPLVDGVFQNCEIFLEREDIVIGVGKRGSISGDEQNFIDIIQLKTGKKNRFFTDEVQLIYHSKDALEVFLKEKEEMLHYSLDIDTLEERSKTQENISAFFKLLYNWGTKSYENLIFENPLGGEDTGYFTRKLIGTYTMNESNMKPKYFVEKVFTLGTDEGMIDVWESSIYNEIRFSDK